MSHVTLGVTVCLITNTEKKDYERVRPGSLQKINPDYSSSFSTEERPGALQKVNPNCRPSFVTEGSRNDGVVVLVPQL